MEKLPLSNIEKVQSFVKSGMTKESIYKAYDDWAQNGIYDEQMAAVGSKGPLILANLFASLYSENNRDISILDVAAGTGRGGDQLSKKGFTTIDAVDPSHKMLEQAKLKGVYRNFFCAPVGYAPLDIRGGTYDAVSCVGGLAEGHLPAESLLEMLRLVKKNGLVVMVSNGNTWRSFPEYSVKMANMIDDLVNKGTIAVLKREFLEGYRMCSESEYAKAIVLVIKKLC